jgi:hypothetical protein
MEEKTVFWVSGKLGTAKKTEPKNLADTDDFAAALRKACEAHGCRAGSFVSARGAFGSWLLQFSRGGKERRVIWDGRAERLILQVMADPGHWQEITAQSVEARDLDGFVAGLETILVGDG